MDVAQHCTKLWHRAINAREYGGNSSPLMYPLSFSVSTVMASTTLRPPSAGSERRVERHGRKMTHRVNQGLSYEVASSVSTATCRQTRAIRHSSCQAGELSYEVVSNVSTDTGNQCLTT